VIAVLGQAVSTAKLATPHVDYLTILPVLILIGGAVVLLVGGSLLQSRAAMRCYGPFAALVGLAAGISAIPEWHRVFRHHAGARPFSAIAGAVGVDGFALFATFTICAAVVLSSLFLDGYVEREGLDGVEPFVLVLLSASGGVVMAAANDLIVMFLGLEILSIAVYVLAGMHTRRVRSSEAAIKYFVLGGFSSAFFLYGIALCYGATGSTNLVKISNFLATNALSNDLLLLGGIMLLIVGFGFKVAAVPFHSWTPDVYQGAPTPITGFMASAVKVAGFAGFLRVFFLAFPLYRLDWQPIIYALAVLSLLVGSFVAIVQTDVKRLLAYSSISHAGFILVGLETARREGVSASLFYLACYTFMVAGSFGVVAIIGRRGDGAHSLTEYKGLARREPVLAFLLTVFLLAQAGVPFTAGFVAKFEILVSAVQAHSYWLALIAMLSAVVGAYLYLKVVITMYAGETEEEAAAPVGSRLFVPWGAKLGLALAFVFVVGVGIVPGPLTNMATRAVPHLIAGATNVSP
jgi:NADH-quinone oxidoreductase subunit N